MVFLSGGADAMLFCLIEFGVEANSHALAGLLVAV
jgi:hypothetical protein